MSILLPPHLSLSLLPGVNKVSFNHTCCLQERFQSAHTKGVDSPLSGFSTSAALTIRVSDLYSYLLRITILNVLQSPVIVEACKDVSSAIQLTLYALITGFQSKNCLLPGVWLGFWWPKWLHFKIWSIENGACLENSAWHLYLDLVQERDFQFFKYLSTFCMLQR